jgi:Domain of unknown function (DUF6046)
MPVYIFDKTEPLDMKIADIPAQERRGNGSLRLDTGAADAQVYNQFGTPVFSSARLIDPEDDTNSIDLLTVIFTVNQTKNIDTVRVNGLSGTIKTYINDGDFEVRMMVVLTTDNADDYPIDVVRQLTGLLKIGKSLKVQSDFLLLFGIYEITVMSYTVGQLEGIQNAQVFDVNCLSDTPVVLIEKR